MNTEMNYAFIASSKVIRHMINPKAADILATLIYKHKYWQKEGKLSFFKGRKGFFMSYDDLTIETSFKKDVIRKNLKLLVKAGILETAQQGLGKSNYYFIDESKILKYIKDHEANYDRWSKKLMSQGAPVTSIPTMKTRKPVSRNGNARIQKVAKVSGTKNKSTKNKSTKNYTNPINWDSLEGLIEDLNFSQEEHEIVSGINNLYTFLTEAIPKFNGFMMSEQDSNLLREINEYNSECFHIADKIRSNAEDIIKGIKECRFGNLFVGLKEINDGFSIKYGK